MKPWENDLYLKYIVARLASYRNVWWSLANEFDLMSSKTMADWDRNPKSEIRNIVRSVISAL